MVNFLFKNANLDIETRINNLLNQLTIEEKFKLLGGSRYFQTHSIKRLGIKPFKMTDGPYGISAHSSMLRKNTQFPGGINLAATFNRQLAYEFGIAAAEEARALGRHAILAPGINIQRTPLCGRNFEYFSEDPYLTKEIAIPYVKGVQSQGVAACIKHYVANNQENNRFIINAEINERTLNEVYLRAFRETIKESDPWMVMSSYNKVNGNYLHANKTLLKDTLWKKWNFSGFIVSDWWAVSRSKPPVSTEECIKAGLSLEMPKGEIYNSDLLKKLYNKKKITDEDINTLLKRLLRVMCLTGLFNQKNRFSKGKRNTLDHQNLALKMAEEGIVLLKNRNDILPILSSSISSIAILGPNKNKKFGGILYGGSSAVRPPYEITPLEGIKRKCKNKIKITDDPSKADIAIVFAGLNHSSSKSIIREDGNITKEAFGHDSEGTDRIQLELPLEQVSLINETVKRNPKTIVVLINGSPIAMDGWLENVPAVVEVWYPGMEGGNAIANILFGDINPSGKLPITFPKKLKDSPAHKSSQTYPGENFNVYYEEGIYIGYKQFDKKNIEPLFPFGYGSSYTSFKYNNFYLSKNKVSHSNDKKTTISVEITNTGFLAGSEIVQIYFNDAQCPLDRPVKELVGFEKVFIKPGETRIVNIDINTHDLQYYNDKSHEWKASNGEFRFFIGDSSRNIQSEFSIEYLS